MEGAFGSLCEILSQKTLCTLLAKEINKVLHLSKLFRREMLQFLNYLSYLDVHRSLPITDYKIILLRFESDGKRQISSSPGKPGR
jgi:hypothetical protein